MRRSKKPELMRLINLCCAECKSSVQHLFNPNDGTHEIIKACGCGRWMLTNPPYLPDSSKEKKLDSIGGIRF